MFVKDISGEDMSELELFIAYTVFGVLNSAIGAYALWKITHLHDEIMTIVDEAAEELLQKATSDPEMQKKLYVLGGILGQGIREGIGLQKGSGSQKLNLGNLIMSFLGNRIPGLGGGESQPQNSNTQRPNQM